MKLDLEKKIVEALRKADSESDPILVDFRDDEIHWDRIAKVALDTVQNYATINPANNDYQCGVDDCTQFH